jgi:type IV pilus biogenesis protein CpaD/CtpE
LLLYVAVSGIINKKYINLSDSRMATISNLYVDAGATYSNIITVTASNGQALDLTSYTVASQMRKSYSSSTVHAFTASVYEAANGKIRLQLTNTQSEAIPAGRWLYDVEITSPSGTKTRVVEGIVTVNPQITQI